MSGNALEIELILKADRARGEIEATRLRIDALQKQVHEFNTTGARLDRLKESFASIATAVGGVALAAVGAGHALATMAGNAEDHADAISSLGSAWDLVRQATNDTVTAEQALRVQQQLTQAGMRVSAEQLAVITRRAREYAESMGGDVGQALDQATGALRGMTADGLHNFGVSIDANRSRTENFNSAIDQMRDSFHGAAPAARDMGEELGRTERTFTDLAGRIASAAANAIHLREALSALADLASGDWHARMARTEQSTAALAAHNTASESNTAARNLAGRSGLTYHARDVGRFTTEQLNGLTEATQRAARLGDQSIIDAYLGQVDSAGANDIVAGITRAATEAGRNASAEYESQITARNALAANDNSKERRTSTRHSDDVTARAFGASDAGRALFASLSAGGAGALFNEEMAADAALTAEVQSNADAREQARLDEDKALTESTIRRGVELDQQRLDEAKHQREINSVRTQLDQRFASHAELNQTTAQNLAGTVEGAYNTMTGAIRNHIAAVIQGKEDVGTAIKATLQEILLNLAAESATKAIMETAMGFAALARGVGSYGADTGAVVSAPMHFTSAAMFAGIALGAGAGYAGVSAIGGGAGAGAGAGFGGSPGAAASTRGPGGSANDNAGGGTIVVNVNGFAMTEPGVQDAVAGALEGYGARGRIVRGVRMAS